MKLLQLELYNCARFDLGDIKHIIVTLEEALQIVLGTNGSGKSAYLDYTLPCAPDSSDFKENGYRKAKWEHEGKIITIENHFPEKGSPTHTFAVDGIELNDGETSKVQADLVKRYTGMDRPLQNLLIGNITFTEMSLQERKDWLTRISPCDIDLLFSLHKRVEKECRDRKGFVANVDKIVAEESTELNELEAKFSTIDDSLTELQSTIKELQALDYRHLDLDPEQIKREILDTIESINDLTDSVLKLDYPASDLIPSDHLMDLEYIESNGVQSVKESLNTNRTMYHHLCSELETLNTQIEKADIALLEETRSKEKQLNDNRKVVMDREELLAKQCNVKIPDNAGNLKTVLNSMAVDLGALFDRIPVDADHHFSRDNFHQSKQAMEECQRSLHELDKKIDSSHILLDHFNDAHTADCPSCNYTFKPGFEQVDPQEVKQLLDRYVVDKDRLLKTLTERENEFKQQDAYRDTREHIVHMLSYLPEMTPLRNYVLSDNIYRKNPETIRGIVDSYTQLLQCHHDLFLINEEYKKVSNLLESLEAIHCSEIDKVKQRRDDAELKVQALQEAIDNDLATLRTLEKLKVDVKTYINTADSFTTLDKLLTDLTSQQLKHYFDVNNKQALDTLLNKLAEINTLTNAIESKRSLVDNYTRNRVKAVEEGKALRYLADSLSPGGGLISDLLAGSIGTIFHQMNRVIAAVWTYDLHILDKGDSDVKAWLKYRFPFCINNTKRPIPDIKNGSSAQKDIINFAFRLVVYTYLDLKGFPLYLDELGKTFDEEHRTRVMTYIRSCLDSQVFSQVFMISHYAVQYTHLIGRSEALVLCNTNIIPPQSYNTHATIK